MQYLFKQQLRVNKITKVLAYKLSCFPAVPRRCKMKRVMKQLGIDMIAAYSPKALGRSERVFATRQDRFAQGVGLAELP